MKILWSLKVKSGSGSSLKNFFNKAANWIELSSSKFIFSGFWSNNSVKVFRRRILPFFLNIPSIVKSFLLLLLLLLLFNFILK